MAEEPPSCAAVDFVAARPIAVAITAGSSLLLQADLAR